MPWVELEAAGQAQLVRWAAVKAPDRALEKVFRVYGGDASRLLDCCRQARPRPKPPPLRRCRTAVRAPPISPLLSNFRVLPAPAPLRLRRRARGRPSTSATRRTCCGACGPCAGTARRGCCGW